MHEQVCLATANTLMISVSRKRNIIDSLAIAAISGYQRHLSPRKGFACAHRVLHGGDSCSQYVKGAIAQNGLIAAIALSKQRFAQCKIANEMLQAKRFNSRRRNCRKCCSRLDFCDVPLEVFDCCGDLGELGDCLPDVGDCGHLDCSPDCGSCEVGSCDCSW